MNILAEELNKALEGCVAGRLMSGMGKRIYFPKGIIAQSAEAKAAPEKPTQANATIGMAFGKGKPLSLSATAECFKGLPVEKVIVYAATGGLPDVRDAWETAMLKKNPSLNEAVEKGEKNYIKPVVVPGITAGLSYTADLFTDKGQPVIISTPSWDNYPLIFAERREAELIEAPFFQGKALNIDSIKTALENSGKQKRILLNFPNNPSGYAPTNDEAEKLINLIKESAEAGNDILVMVDDAYFGFFYEDDVYKESLFARLCNLHQNVLAVKLDGPTKEDYSWGLRQAFVTMGFKGMSESENAALNSKMLGLIRSSVSCSNTPAQLALLKSFTKPETLVEKAAFFNTLKERYIIVRKFVTSNICQALIPLPFNSGYFMSFLCRGFKAETLRKELLSKYSIGVVALPGLNGKSYIRVAYSSLDAEQIPGVYRHIYDAALEIMQG
ncbi:MAG: aminotransferase class I/II-fold pyridoxal phosphate-dependent enzyme [Spirochaetaceae bacterium]|jgi:aspartate/methionine/tyrosine aminotransferase|nr:aminotransferase class I/II-fold pyridoxal phosphate-dependent enzyme [Spirochaetaceae bacterium]